MKTFYLRKKSMRCLNHRLFQNRKPSRNRNIKLLPAGEEEDLTRKRDVIGEIGNISMGSAATLYLT